MRQGKPQSKLYYGADVSGRRGRVAVGLTDTEWITYGATDGSSGACTPEELRDYMARQGSRFAVMMDGGGKVNLYVKAAGVLMEGRDPSNTLILLWLADDDNKEEIPVSEKKTGSAGRRDTTPGTLPIRARTGATTSMNSAWTWQSGSGPT